MEIRFTPEECKTIIDISNNSEKKLGQNLNYRTKHSYKYTNISYNATTDWIFERVSKFFTQSSGLDLVLPLNQISIHSYNEGEYFDRHSDQDYAIFSIGACLNDEYEGGDFKVYSPDYTVPKDVGLIYYFDSRKQHQITKITKGTRWSLICFVLLENLNTGNKQNLI